MEWPKWKLFGRPVFERPPPMPVWYWVIYWTMPVIGISLLLWYRYHPVSTGWMSLTVLYVGAGQLIVITIIWKKAPPRVRPWVTLFLVILALLVLWTALGGRLNWNWD